MAVEQHVAQVIAKNHGVLAGAADFVAGEGVVYGFFVGFGRRGRVVAESLGVPIVGGTVGCFLVGGGEFGEFLLADHRRHPEGWRLSGGVVALEQGQVYAFLQHFFVVKSEKGFFFHRQAKNGGAL